MTSVVLNREARGRKSNERLKPGDLQVLVPDITGELGREFRPGVFDSELI